MTRDFAKTQRPPARRKKESARARGSSKPASPPWQWFVAGFACGIFLCAMVWLAYQQPDDLAAQAGPQVRASKADPEPSTPKPRFDFYTLLPEQKIDVEVDTDAAVRRQQQASVDQFLLQAGSFKLPEDADRRRAELLLLGLTAHVEEATTDNGRWYRVYIGPFDSRSRLAKARSLTAQQGIDTLLLRRPKPGPG